MKMYKIGNMIWCWDNNKIALKSDPFMELFAIKEEELERDSEKVYYKIEECNFDKMKKDAVLVESIMYQLWQVKDDKLVVYPWIGKKRFAYGYFMNQLKEENEITCYFDSGISELENFTDTHFFSNAAMHSKLLQRNAAIVHASYIAYEDKAILFTAPSQTGKSTQARLWQEYEGAEIINGDRALLRQVDGVWHAFGYPGCGTSGICKNKTMPISAIVVLEQGVTDKVVSMSPSEKIRSLVLATEVFKWNEWEVDKAFEVAEQVANQVPIVKLSCTPSKEAAETLKRYLEESL